MSLFILMQENNQMEDPSSIYQQLAQQVALLLSAPQFQQVSILSRSSISITLGFPRSPITFVRDSQWLLEIKANKLKISVSFLQSSGLNYLRAQSSRMKLQLMILLRQINSRLPIQQQFYVEPINGMLLYFFLISWKDYKQKLKGADGLRKLIRYLLSQLNTYAQLIFFCQPLSYQQNCQSIVQQCNKQLEDLNRYRLLLKSTKKFRHNNLLFFQQALEIKNHLKRVQDTTAKTQLDQMRMFFQSNIKNFEQMQVGIEDQKIQNKFQDCIKHLKKNEQGKESDPPDNNIVSGIKILKQGQIKSLSKQGAHSQIMKGPFLFKIKLTISDLEQKNQQWTDGKELKSELVLKRCNTNEEASKNSFMNQLCFLNYIRNDRSNCIGRYYLTVKKFQKRDENDIIYMKPYQDNLYNYIQKTRTLSISDRLKIAYRISKGMCFLRAKSVLHRDLKPFNILLDHKIYPIIIDFGSCSPILHENKFLVRDQRLLTTKFFHIHYKDIPQNYQGIKNRMTIQQYNKHPLFDVYSFGRVLSFLFFQKIIPPSPDQIQEHPYSQLIKNILFIIMQCLNIDPDDRPTFAQITSFIGKLHGFVDSLPVFLAKKERSLSQPHQ